MQSNCEMRAPRAGARRADGVGVLNEGALETGTDA